MTRRLCAVLSIVLMLVTARLAAAEQVIFLVRHAEKAASPAAAAQPSHSMLGDDPPLSPAGEQRAAKLAAALAQSGITAIYTTEFKRTRQTAAPLGEKLKLTPVMSAAKDPGPLVAALKKARGPVLVVDNLFVVVRSSAGQATLIRLKY